MIYYNLKKEANLHDKLHSVCIVTGHVDDLQQIIVLYMRGEERKPLLWPSIGPPKPNTLVN